MIPTRRPQTPEKKEFCADGGAGTLWLDDLSWWNLPGFIAAARIDQEER